MDATLKNLIDANPDGTCSEGDAEISGCELKVIDAASGKIELLHDGSASGPHYTLKSLGELFGGGTPSEHVDPQKLAFLPLFLAIEEAIVTSYRVNTNMADADAAIALDLLNTDPAGDVCHNPLAHDVQLRLRLLLSIENYSRQEVRQAIRKILKSIHRHTSQGGRWGYLEFIDEYLP